MDKVKADFGIIGLGRIGGNLALQALDKGMRVLGFTLGGADQELLRAGLEEFEDPLKLVESLPTPRLIFIYIPAGRAVDDILSSLSNTLSPGDIVVDGGNSYWRDSIRRHEVLKDRGIHFVDMGTSGGLSGARTGACFMAGGEKDVVSAIEPIIKRLAVPGGFVYTGPAGSGHFTKLVHNGIEFGMMQAIGEGIDLLEHYKDDLDIHGIVKAWQNGSVIRSWLIDLLARGYEEHPGLDDIPGYIEDTGEVNWLVEDGARLGVPLPVIAQSVWQLMQSRDEVKAWAKAIAVMRKGFGAHPLGKDETIAKNRAVSRMWGEESANHRQQ